MDEQTNKKGRVIPLLISEVQVSDNVMDAKVAETEAKSNAKHRQMFEENKILIASIKAQKESWVSSDAPRGDIPPTVMVEKDGEELCTVIAPQVDKYQGLRAFQVLRGGFDPDYLTILFDAHYAAGTKGESEEEFAKKFPPGSMQKMCDEGNACELGIITDCIQALRMGRNGKIMMINLPYSYHGPGTKFMWYDDKLVIHDENDDEDGAPIMGGHIPDTLRKIMATPSIQEAPQFRMLMGMFKLEGGEKEQLLRLGRVSLQMLLHEGFFALIGPALAELGEFSDPSVQMQRLHPREEE